MSGILTENFDKVLWIIFEFFLQMEKLLNYLAPPKYYAFSRIFIEVIKRFY